LPREKTCHKPKWRSSIANKKKNITQSNLNRRLRSPIRRPRSWLNSSSGRSRREFIGRRKQPTPLLLLPLLKLSKLGREPSPRRMLAERPQRPRLLNLLPRRREKRPRLQRLLPRRREKRLRPQRLMP